MICPFTNFPCCIINATKSLPFFSHSIYQESYIPYIICGISNNNLYCASNYKRRLIKSKYMTLDVGNYSDLKSKDLHHYHYENCCEHYIIIQKTFSRRINRVHYSSNMYPCIDLISYAYDNILSSINSTLVLIHYCFLSP